MTTMDIAETTYGHYSHDVLVHANDDDLVAASRAFVQQGLESGGHVLVHSTQERVALLFDALGTHERLQYGLDRDLYESPSATLFAYQHQLETSAEPIELWATGTVPLGESRASQAAWARYESLVNEALGSYAFHGLCTYDSVAWPPEVIAAARATHPHTWTASGRRPTAEYADPAAFLTSELAGVPAAPEGEPAVLSLWEAADLAQARRVLHGCARRTSLPVEHVDGLVLATNEVLVNGLLHGVPPVRLEVWAEQGRLTCRVTDGGPGIADTLAGYRFPDPDGPMGLWVARQMCENFFVTNSPSGGCTVLLSTP